MKKILFTIGSFTAMAAPIVGVVSCGPSGKHKIKEEYVGADKSKVQKMVTDGGVVTDKSFNQQAFDALALILGHSPKKSDYVTATGHDKSAILDGYNSAVQNKADMIVAAGFFHVAPINQFIEDNGTKNVGFLLVDGVVKHSNVASIVFKTKLSGFEAGYLAAAYENFTPNVSNGVAGEEGTVTPAVKKSHKLGVFGGANFPGVTDYMVGFIEGVKYYNDKVAKKDEEKSHFIQLANKKAYTDTGFEVGGAKAVSDKYVAAGADVILPVAGPQTADVLKAISDAGKQTKVIGVDTDQKLAYSKDKTKFLTSILKNMKSAISRVYKKAHDKSTGEPTIKGFGETTVGTLENKLTGITTNDQESLSALYKKATSSEIQTAAKAISDITWDQAYNDLVAMK